MEFENPDIQCQNFIDLFTTDGIVRTRVRILLFVNLALELACLGWFLWFFKTKSVSKQTPFTKTMVIALFLSSIIQIFRIIVFLRA